MQDVDMYVANAAGFMEGNVNALPSEITQLQKEDRATVLSAIEQTYKGKEYADRLNLVRSALRVD